MIVMSKTWPLANLLLFLPLYLMVGCLAASTHKNNSPKRPPDKVFVAIADIKCDEVLKTVRKKIQQDPLLDIIKEVKARESTRFVLKKMARPSRKWQASIVVDCFKRDPMVSRLSVDVYAERLNQKGQWEKDPDTTDLQNMILDKITPLFK